MRCVHHERIGKTLSVATGAVVIQRSVELKDVFPAGKGVSVVFDFAGEGDDQVVHLTRNEGRKEECGHWKLKAVNDRDSAGLKGFKSFAESLDLTGAQLAHLIMGFKP